jgi:hypothetical protein
LKKALSNLRNLLTAVDAKYDASLKWVAYRCQPEFIGRDESELISRNGQYVKENDVDVKKVVADTLAERRGGDVDMA